jgi:hypothetical protein
MKDIISGEIMMIEGGKQPSMHPRPTQKLDQGRNSQNCEERRINDLWYGHTRPYGVTIPHVGGTPCQVV